jgi:hypothetical protein
VNEEPPDPAVTRVLGTYARSLRDIQPSAALDARLAASIQQYARVRHARPIWLRPLPWAIAAASVAVIATGVTLLLVRKTPEPVLPVAAVVPPSVTGDQIALPSSQYSLWPTQGAVFRVKASLDTAPAAGERQYWVDVRVANDGSMRIVRVIPANGNE